MDKKDIALKFLKYFCSSNIDGIESLLVDDFKLAGPVFKCTTRAAYIAELRNSPPRNSIYKVLGLYEHGAGEEICIFYELTIPGSVVTIAQIFKFRGEKIAECILVFDHNVSP